MTDLTIEGVAHVELPVFRCGECRGNRPHYLPDSGVSVCAACGYVRDEIEVQDPS